uniref:Sulfotransferase n=1 Tax=Brassica campestris TaxID=3711 RepID=M4ECM8_BRACM
MFVSLWHFGKKLAPEETADYPIEKAVEAFCLELKKQTGDTIKRIAEFLGCGFIEAEEVRGIVKLCSFESLSSLEANREGKLPNGVETKAFFRKGEVGGWRDTLSESLAEEIDRTMEEKFQGSGLKFSC